MTSTAQAPGVDLAYQPHEQEALLLVELVRNSRLSLLYAEAGSDKTALLRHGLIPLLSRRAGDRLGPTAVRGSGVVVPFPDRRSRPSVYSSKRRRELVVYLGTWTEKPLVALRGSLCAAVAADPADSTMANGRLGAVLADLSQRFDAHVVVVLDRFEDLLRASSDELWVVQFVSELAEAINQPKLAANFLIALAEEAKPRLAGLRTCIPGFDDSSLKLTATRDANPVMARIRQQAIAPAAAQGVPVLTDTVPASRRDPVPSSPTPLASLVRAPAKRFKAPPFPRVEIKTEDVYTMIDAVLTRISLRTTAVRS